MIQSARTDREKIYVLMMTLFAEILCVLHEKVTKSGRKFSARRRRQLIQRLPKGFVRELYHKRVMLSTIALL